MLLLELCTSTYSVHAGVTKPCRGRHPCPLVVFSRLLSSLVWAQLTLLVPALGFRPFSPQYGCPIHRVRAYPLTGIRNSKTVVRANALHQYEIQYSMFATQFRLARLRTGGTVQDGGCPNQVGRTTRRFDSTVQLLLYTNRLDYKQVGQYKMVAALYQ